jgi:hypothetical protein
MFRLDHILERWAELYTPLSHNSVSAGSASGAKKSFFRIGMIDAQSYFVRNYNMMNGCCMAYATHVDAELVQQNPKAVSYRHVIYFLAKQQNAQGKTDVTDEDAATEARFLTDDMVQDLLAVLWAMKGAVNGKQLPSIQGGAGGGSDIADFIEQTARDPEYAEGLRGLQLEQAHWGTLPTVFNGWQLCGLTIEQVTPRLLCVNPERYVKE